MISSSNCWKQQHETFNNFIGFRVLEHKLTVLFADGWAKSDLVYVWQDGNPVQLAGNLSLPGGFQLGAFGSEYCDVVTATGEA